MKYAIVQGATVVNVVVWDGVATWNPPVGTVAVQLDPSEWVDIGAQYDANASPRFTAVDDA